MPKVFVSVAVLMVFIVMIVLGAGVWGEHAKRYWLRQQQAHVKAQRAAHELRVRKLRSIQVWEHAATTDSTQAAMLHQLADDLRRELGLPLKDYPPSTARPGPALQELQQVPPHGAVSAPLPYTN
jgi:hypothetical protein